MGQRVDANKAASIKGLSSLSTCRTGTGRQVIGKFHLRQFTVRIGMTGKFNMLRVVKTAQRYEHNSIRFKRQRTTAVAAEASYYTLG